MHGYITVTCDQTLKTVGAFLERESAIFGNFAIFSQTTPILVEFVEEKKGSWFLP
jgi:hypothetical protein